MKQIYRLKAVLIAAAFLLFAFGCASAPKDFDPGVKGAQLIADPQSISLGAVTVLQTPIVFKGKGFKPGDSVFVSLIGVDKGGQKTDVPLADATVNEEGRFSASVATLPKVTELLRGDMGTNAKNENIVVLSRPPIPEGAYTARAVSMESDIKAETTFTIKRAGAMDALKDWIGTLKGKIVKK